MAKFKCMQTGQVYEFALEHDVVQMRKHPDYEEVIEETKEDKKVKQPVKSKDE